MHKCKFLYFLLGLSACSSNQCANGAACLPVADSCTQYTCECPACFTGPFCNIGMYMLAVM